MATHSYDRGGQPDGTLGVSIDTFYGGETVAVELGHGDTAAHLTAGQALELAADLITHANALTVQAVQGDEGGEVIGYKVGDRLYHPDDVVIVRRRPSEEDKIRDAMAEAKQHPGRVVTR